MRAQTIGPTGRHLALFASFALVAACGVVLAASPPADAAGVTARVRSNTLQVRGTNGPDRITLRRAPGGFLLVDVGDDGSADFRFRRGTFTKIVVSGRGGGDRLEIDESRGAFTDTESTRLDGGDGNDRFTGGSYAERFVGGGGKDQVDAKGWRRPDRARRWERPLGLGRR